MYLSTYLSVSLPHATFDPLCARTCTRTYLLKDAQHLISVYFCQSHAQGLDFCSNDVMPAWLSSDVLEVAAISSRSSRSPYDEDKSRKAKAAPVPVPGLLLVETVPVGNAVLRERNSSPSSSVSSTSTSSCRWTLLPDPGNNHFLLYHIVCCPSVLHPDRQCS